MKASLFNLIVSADVAVINGVEVTEVSTDHRHPSDDTPLFRVDCDDVVFYFADQEVEVDSGGCCKAVDYPDLSDPTEEVTEYELIFQVLNPITEGDLCS